MINLNSILAPDEIGERMTNDGTVYTGRVESSETTGFLLFSPHLRASFSIPDGQKSSLNGPWFAEKKLRARVTDFFKRHFQSNKKYVAGMNKKKAAGYNDWRVPTKEEKKLIKKNLKEMEKEQPNFLICPDGRADLFYNVFNTKAVRSESYIFTPSKNLSPEEQENLRKAMSKDVLRKVALARRAAGIEP